MTYQGKKYHRSSIRLPGYDYTQPGAYFVTICTYKKQYWFGDVVDGEMWCNQLGKIVYTFWQGLPRRFPHIQLDEFVVMPNHVHGILIITDEGKCKQLSLTTQEQFSKPVPGSIPTVIRSFKSSVTKRINLMRRTKEPPVWQRNYFESITRIEMNLDGVRQYIGNNPRQWAEDENYQAEDGMIDLDLYF
ncbi:MAG: transposase [Calothrix sp. MO_167.B12]|nr:transposase [Calothrix sp. MO_167.B12]